MPSALQTLLGLSAQGGGGADALELASLRGKRRSELIPQAEAGDPLAMNRLRTVESELMADPYTGIDEQERVAGIQGALDEAATFNRPEIRGMREEQQQTALAKLLLPVYAKAAAGRQEKDVEFAQQLLRDRLNSQDIAERQTAARADVGARATASQQAQLGRAQQADRFKQAAEKRKAASKVNRLFNMFTGEREKLMREADELSRPQAGGSEVSQIAAVLSSDPRYAGKGIDELIQMGVVDADSPEEIAALQEALAAAGVR